LNLKLIPERIYRIQDDFYPSVANQFGVPLDSRHTVSFAFSQLLMVIPGYLAHMIHMLTYLSTQLIVIGFMTIVSCKTNKSGQKRIGKCLPLALL
jgi:hypothetical protein